MSKTIVNLYGVIVDGFYDDPFFDDIIGTGCITPSSRFIYQVASAQGDLEIHVNSYGGDVFSANSMIIALRAWAASHPDANIDIIVESIALSAAANFIAMAPKAARIHAYAPSLIMFHSCSTITWGGPGAHKDAADLMDKINGGVKAALKSRTSLDQAAIDTWFQDAREGWLSAEEAKQCKLIDDVMDGEPQAAPEKPSDTLENKAIAAFYSGQQSLLALHINQQGDKTMPTAEDDDNKNKEEEEKKDPEQEETEKKDEEEKKDPDQNGDDNEEKKDEEEKKDPDQNGDDNEEKKDEDPEQSAKKLLATLEERVAQLSKENADLKQQLDTANNTVAKLTKGLHMQGKAAPKDNAPQNFNDLVATIDPNLSAQEWSKKYLQLKKNYPQLFEQTYGIPATSEK